MMRSIAVLVIAALLGLAAAIGAPAQEPASAVNAAGAAGAGQLHWQVATLLPPVAMLAVISGDPTQPVETTMLVSMPDGYQFPPHFHPGYEHVEVKEGTLLAGMGDRIDPTHTHALTVGDSATAPAGMHHFSIAKGHTVLAVSFMGPYTLTYLRAEDAPQRRAFPFGY